MCGIVGIFDSRSPSQIDRGLLERMNEIQHHRGPDEGGIHIEPGIGLGHRRLSIIDLSNGQQPLFNEDGSVVVVYNGEIYNFPELSEELKQHGHVFRTHCDTEVIVHAWEQWGEQCVDRFRGMFAFALWDRNQETLFLARDRLGVKPLYYSVLTDGRVLFSSELKAILIDPNIPRQIEPRSVEDYFAFGYVPEPRTILTHVQKLPPGHVLAIKRHARITAPKQYWDVHFHINHPITEEEAQEELISRLREAVKIRLVAEVPLGAFLSGGVDSSAVVAMMAGLSDQPVNTCSISFQDPRYNEAEYAAKVAIRYQTNHFVEQAQHDDFDLIDELANLYDEPFADSSALPTYRVCQLARKRVVVALSGDGGDENLAGYRRYRWHMHEERIRSALPLSVRRPLFGLLGKIYPKADWAPKIFRAKSTFQALSRNSLEAYFHSVSVIPDHLRKQLFRGAFHKELQGYRAMDVFHDHAHRSSTSHPLSLIQYLDLKTYLPGDILTKVDRASMAHSLEVRGPLLDHKLIEWLAGLPPTFKLKGREGKSLFKSALRNYLPEDILYRPKMGFAVPLASWFRGPLRENVKKAVLGPTLAETSYFNRKFLEKLVSEHQSGIGEHSTALWSLLMFEAFLRKVLRC